MKKYLPYLAITVLLMGAALETSRYGWSLPRGIVDTDDTILSADAQNDAMVLANIPSSAYKPAEGQNCVEVAWSMTADGDSCVVYIFAARKNGDIVLVWQGTLTAGTQVATDSRRWVDTITTTTDNWITTVKLVDEGGANRMSRVVFDTCGYTSFFCQYTGLTGAETVKAYWSGY